MLVEQRREGLDGNIRLLAQRSGDTNANKCFRAGLDDDAARCARSERGEGQRSWRIGALLATDGTFATSQPHWRGLVEHEDGALRAENISTDEEGKREALNNEQGMVHRDAGDYNGHVDVAAYLSAGTSNADDVRCCACEWLDHGSVAQSREECTAQH